MEEISFSEMFSLDQKISELFSSNQKNQRLVGFFSLPHFKKSLISKISPTFEHIHAERISK